MKTFIATECRLLLLNIAVEITYQLRRTCIFTVQCAVLSSPASGSYVLTTDGLATVAVFTCASKYSMVGTGQLTCDMSGEWDGKEPVCSKTYLF